MDLPANYHQDSKKPTIDDTEHASTPQMNRKHTKCWLIRTKNSTNTTDKCHNQYSKCLKSVLIA